jgi:hypothetical protein
MKNFLISILMLISIATAQDTCTVHGNIYMNEIGGTGLGGVICTTEVLSGGVAYVDKYTSLYGSGHFELKYSRGSIVRIRLIKEGWNVTTVTSRCLTEYDEHNKIAQVLTFNVGHSLNGGAIKSINGDTLLDAFVIYRSKTLTPTEILWYENRNLPYDWSGKIDTVYQYSQYGLYKKEFPYGWSGTLTAVLDGYSFTPESYTIDTLKTYSLDNSFIGTPATSIAIKPTIQPKQHNQQNHHTYNIAGRKILQPRKLHPIIQGEHLIIKDR